jgi:mRNA-degrading endonuclease toxin of MazEF toxin-antitoxin module
MMAHVEVRPPDGGLPEVSFAMCEQVRSLAADRLAPQPFGSVPVAVLGSVEDRRRLLLGL